MKRKADELEEDADEPGTKKIKITPESATTQVLLRHKGIVGSHIAPFLETTEIGALIRSCKGPNSLLRNNPNAFKRELNINCAGMVPLDGEFGHITFMAKISPEIGHLGMRLASKESIINGTRRVVTSWKERVEKILEAISLKCKKVRTLCITGAGSNNPTVDPATVKFTVELLRLRDGVTFIGHSLPFVVMGLKQVDLEWWDIDTLNNATLLMTPTVHSLTILLRHPNGEVKPHATWKTCRCGCDLMPTDCMLASDGPLLHIEELTLVYQDACTGETDDSHITAQSIHKLLPRLKRVTFKAKRIPKMTRPYEWTAQDITYFADKAKDVVVDLSQWAP